MGQQTIVIKGMDRFRKNLQKLIQNSPLAIAGPLYQFAEEQIAGPARDTYVPVATGALRSSIIVQLPVIEGTRVSVIIGAGGVAAPYALAVHENPRSGHTEGVSPSGKKYKRWSRVGQWKYLETPAMEAAANSAGLIQAIKRNIEGQVE